jgi:hypothetical protein
MANNRNQSIKPKSVKDFLHTLTGGFVYFLTLGDPPLIRLQTAVAPERLDFSANNCIPKHTRIRFWVPVQKKSCSANFSYGQIKSESVPGTSSLLKEKNAKMSNRILKHTFFVGHRAKQKSNGSNKFRL